MTAHVGLEKHSYLFKKKSATAILNFLGESTKREI